MTKEEEMIYEAIDELIEELFAPIKIELKKINDRLDRLEGKNNEDIKD